MLWSYGITTVPERAETTLPATIETLDRAGFDKPHIFLDGQGSTGRLGILRNWMLSAFKLYLVEPLADRYAVFQDDLIMCRGVREYLERVRYPNRGYLNLYTFPHNEPKALHERKEDGKRTHPDLPPDTVGFYPSCQHGKSAVALVFDNFAMTTLFCQPEYLYRPQDPIRGKSCIDGVIIDSLREQGFKEYVHTPSLTFHTGIVSTKGGIYPVCTSFRGTDFDAMSLL